MSFERWLLVQQQKADPGSAADPLLPDLGGKKDPDRLLVAELLEAGASKKEAKRLSNYLGKHGTVAKGRLLVVIMELEGDKAWCLSGWWMAAKSSTKAVRQLQRQFPGGATASTNQGVWGWGGGGLRGGGQMRDGAGALCCQSGWRSHWLGELAMPSPDH